MLFPPILAGANADNSLFSDSGGGQQCIYHSQTTRPIIGEIKDKSEIESVQKRAMKSRVIYIEEREKKVSWSVGL